MTSSHFYLALYWAEILAQSDDAEVKAKFESVAKALAENESKIVEELNSVQGKSMEIGGYYFPNQDAASDAMRPSETLNSLISTLG